jgi:hypothetical protein
MLFFFVGISAVLLVVVNALALFGGKSGMRTAIVLCGVALGVGLCLVNRLIPLHALFLAIALAVCAATGARPRWVLASSLGATVVAYAVFGATVWPQVREWERLKPAYPMESLAARLAYEDRPRGADSGRPDPKRLSGFEGQITEKTSGLRVENLERLHAGVVEQFVNSPGFGVGRQIIRPSASDLEKIDLVDSLREGPPEPVPQWSRSYFSPDPIPAPALPAPDLIGPHDDNAVAFLNPFGFGYVRDREHVAGFRPHQFRREPAAPKRWQVERLELVGLLKYDEPVAYLSENLPKMDELRDVETRPLDAFEQEALAALRRGEDLMVQEAPDRMRMLGSLRAVRQCVRCHHAERGELLGAFSYKLSREATKD